MKYKTWNKLAIILLILEIIFGYLFISGSRWSGLLFLILMAVSIVSDLLFNRCPHCGRHLGRSGGPYCRYCGEELDEGESNGKEQK